MRPDCPKNNIEIYIKIASTRHHLQGAHYPCTDNALLEDGVTAPKHVRAILM
jgi:hypothetical protein